jgi:WD40 repeat protein
LPFSILAHLTSAIQPEGFPGQVEQATTELSRLLTSLDFVSEKVRRLGVDELLADFRDAHSVMSSTRVRELERLCELQAHHLRSGGRAVRPGFTATQLGWEALRVGLDDVASSVAAYLERCAPPQVIPRWTTGRTGHHLLGVIGRHDEGAVEALAVLPDGGVVSGGADRAVRVWHSDRPEESGVVIGRHDGTVEALAVSPDGRVVSGGTDGTVRVWDPGRPDDPGAVIGRHEQRAHRVRDRVILGDGVAAVAVLPDLRVVSAGSDDTIRVWDPAMPGDAGILLGRHRGMQGTVRAILDDERLVSGDGVDCLAVLPDGRVASAGGDGVIRLWDPARPGVELGVLGQHGENAAVLALAVLPSGKVVSGGTDMMLLAWDPSSPDGGEPAVLGEHDDPVLALAALPGTDERVVSGAGTMVRLWDPARRRH